MSFFGLKNKTVISKKRKAPAKKLAWHKDAGIQSEMEKIVKGIGFDHIREGRVFCYRTTGSRARAYARIWAFPKIFQQVLDIQPAYVMEIISEKFDRLPSNEKTKVIIHELLHIPKNFSGSLLPHSYGHTKIEREVNVLYEKYKTVNR